MEWRRLTSMFAPNAVTEIAVDHLRPEEVASVDRIFERFGLLGGKAALSRSERLRRLTGDLEGEFRNILLDLLESPDIRKRISTILDQITTNESNGEIVIAALILQHIGASNSIDLLAELSGVPRINRILLARDPNIAELCRPYGSNCNISIICHIRAAELLVIWQGR
jgi:hypothetical protein